jgi:hypothetical protein
VQLSTFSAERVPKMGWVVLKNEHSIWAEPRVCHTFQGDRRDCVRNVTCITELFAYRCVVWTRCAQHFNERVSAMLSKGILLT